MAYSTADAAAVFDEIADLLEVQGGNAFRVRAYRSAARTLADLGRSAKEMLEAGDDLDDLPGIGRDLAGKIAEIVATGSCAQLDALRQEMPAGITELLRLPGIGPKRVQALRAALGVQSLADLRAAAEQERIRGVRGFSRDAERRILDAIITRLKTERRTPLAKGRRSPRRCWPNCRQCPECSRRLPPAACAAGAIPWGTSTCW